jgi:hypothetical protein
METLVLAQKIQSALENPEITANDLENIQKEIPDGEKYEDLKQYTIVCAQALQTGNPDKKDKVFKLIHTVLTNGILAAGASDVISQINAPSESESP